MKNINENPVAEETAGESPIVEETPVVEETLVEETPKVEEAPVEPVVEEVLAETPVEVPALGAVANGVMGTTTVSKPSKEEHQEPEKDSVEKLAIYSTSNVHWEGVGKVYKGYNVVTKNASEQWLTRPNIRLATPEEVKKAFG